MPKGAKKKQKKVEHRVWETMPLGIYDCELWYKGECLGTKKLTNGDCFFEPFFVYKPGEGTNVLYNWEDENQWAMTMKHWFEARPELFHREEKNYRSLCKEVLALSERGDEKDFDRLEYILEQVWPMLASATSVGNYHEQEPTIISERALQLRRETDHVLYIGYAALDKMIQGRLPDSHKEEQYFLTWQEITNGPLPDQDTLTRRKHGFIYLRGELYHPDDLDKFCNEQNIYIYKEKIESATEIKGTSACKGVVRGRVVRLLDREDEKKDFRDAILVAAMTTPYWINQMNQAKAFVTDLGGITCHAAIIAREIGKPCIIGTKVATQVLRDGDLIEVDADKGVVRVLESAPKKSSLLLATAS